MRCLVSVQFNLSPVAHCPAPQPCSPPLLLSPAPVMAAFWMTFAHSATTACRLSPPSPWPSLLPVARLDARRTLQRPRPFSFRTTGSRFSCACRKGAWPDPQGRQANGQAQARQGPCQASSAVQPAVQEHRGWRRRQEEGAAAAAFAFSFVTSRFVLGSQHSGH